LYRVTRRLAGNVPLYWRRCGLGYSSQPCVALQPDAGTASKIADLAVQLRTQHGLKGKPQSAELLHVTLYFMGHFPGVPQEIVDRSSKALAAFRAPSFDVCFDRVLSFRGTSRRPVVLVGGELLAPLHQFQSRVRSALVRSVHGRGEHQVLARYLLDEGL
jgi:2'-5' RNA ligase